MVLPAFMSTVLPASPLPSLLLPLFTCVILSSCPEGDVGDSAISRSPTTWGSRLARQLCSKAAKDLGEVMGLGPLPGGEESEVGGLVLRGILDTVGAAGEGPEGACGRASGLLALLAAGCMGII